MFKFELQVLEQADADRLKQGGGNNMRLRIGIIAGTVAPIVVVLAVLAALLRRRVLRKRAAATLPALSRAGTADRKTTSAAGPESRQRGLLGAWKRDRGERSLARQPRSAADLAAADVPCAAEHRSEV